MQRSLPGKNFQSYVPALNTVFVSFCRLRQILFGYFAVLACIYESALFGKCMYSHVFEWGFYIFESYKKDVSAGIFQLFKLHQ
jgi:hypothetical protein